MLAEGFFRFGSQSRSLSTTVVASTLSIAALSSALSSSAAAQSGPGSIDSAALSRANFLEENPGAGLFELNGAVTRVYGPAFSHGANAVDSAEKFLKAHLGMLSSDFAQLMPIGPNGDGTHVLPLGYDAATDTYRFSLVGYTQHVNGIPVFRGDVRCLVRNDQGYPLVLVSNALKNVTAFAANFTGKPVSPAKLDVRKASKLPLNQFGPGATISDQEQVIWAGFDAAPAAAPRLAVKFVVTGTGVFDKNAYQRMLYIVDAETNRILYQEDQVLHADVTVQVNGVATTGPAAAACGPEASAPMPYASVTYGSTTLYANAAGALTIPNITANTSFTSVVGGRWFSVNDVANGSVGSLSLSSAGGALNFVHNAANTAEDQLAEVNAYIESNKIRDIAVAANPSFPSIGTQTSWPINVQVSGTCNAFYNGTSINFYPTGGGCNNTAFAQVVHHEYGHHLVNRAGSGQGAYGEGYGDVCSILATDVPQLGLGFQTCSTGIRNADNTCQYSATGCSSCGSAIHSCGQLLSGCVWDLRENLFVSEPTNYRSILATLAIDSVLLHTGTTIAGAITIDFLTLDDNDGNINNGSPHYFEINNAFTAHGLPGPQLDLISISFPGGRPVFSAPNGTTALNFAASAAGGTPAPGTGRFFYRVNGLGSFVEGAVTQVSTNNYRAFFPAAACGASIQYYISVGATNGQTLTNPTGAPSAWYTVGVATGLETACNDTVETNLGWTLTTAGDTATTGLWVRGDPIGTVNGATQVQPDNDVTAAPGVNCFFTGQGTAGGTLGAADVDGGFTTLTSPTMNASGGSAVLSYYRWYSNQQGGAPNADTFRVQISNNNGASWVTLETVGPTGTEVNGGWIFKEFNVASVIAPTAQMKIRFIADDAGTPSLIEAAVDEVKMVVTSCGNPFDLDGDGSVNASDLAILLGNWGGSGAGDLNGDGSIDAADLAALLGAWGT